jgi:hypothetical protein
LARKAKKNDAVMIGILVTRLKIGLINVEDLEQMAEDLSGSERASAAKKVLAAIEDWPDRPFCHYLGDCPFPGTSILFISLRIIRYRGVILLRQKQRSKRFSVSKLSYTVLKKLDDGVEIREHGAQIRALVPYAPGE